MTCSEKLDKVSLFLDTSIPDSLHKGEDFKKRIIYLISQFKWLGISSYSKLEYGNLILSRCEYYIRKINELDSLERTLDWVNNVLRDQSKQVWSFNLLREHYGNSDREATERALYSLTNLMELGTDFVLYYGDREVDKIHDGTQCYWVSRGLRKKSDGSLSWQAPVCKKENRRCNIDKFFQDSISVFKDIAAIISTLSESETSTQLKNFKSTIDLAEKDPTILLDYKNCKSLADVLISIDSQGYKSFFSQNIAESKILCPIMKQVFYYLPPNFEKGIEVYDETGKYMDRLTL